MARNTDEASPGVAGTAYSQPSMNNIGAQHDNVLDQRT